MNPRYSVVLTPPPDGSAFNVTSPDFPDLVTFGETREQALAMALDRADALMLSYLDRGREIPEEGGQAEVATIEVDVDVLWARVVAERAAAPEPASRDRGVFNPTTTRRVCATDFPDAPLFDWDRLLRSRGEATS